MIYFIRERGSGDYFSGYAYSRGAGSGRRCDYFSPHLHQAKAYSTLTGAKRAMARIEQSRKHHVYIMDSQGNQVGD